MIIEKTENFKNVYGFPSARERDTRKFKLMQGIAVSVGISVLDPAVEALAEAVMLDREKYGERELKAGEVVILSKKNRSEVER